MANVWPYGRSVFLYFGVGPSVAPSKRVRHDLVAQDAPLPPFPRYEIGELRMAERQKEASTSFCRGELAQVKHLGAEMELVTVLYAFLVGRKLVVHPTVCRVKVP